jgi:hypothetical protein
MANKMEIDFTNQIIKAKEGKTLNKPFRTPKGPKKFSVYVKNEKGNVVKVNFGDPKMEIKRDDPARRKSFRARHNCDNLLAIYPALAQAEVVAEECEECETEAYHKNKMKKGYADMNPNSDETHDQYMSRCQKAGFSKEECMKSHEGHKFKEQKAPHTEEDHAKRGLWDNIRDKKKREGDDYRPAKPGDKDRPDEKSWKKAQKPKKKKK